jgi:Uma2 family endonuclease
MFSRLYAKLGIDQPVLGRLTARVVRSSAMSAGVRRLHYTYAEYVALEDESGAIRHEYLDGEIYAVAGGTPDHAALAAAVIQVLGRSLPRGCRAFSADLRVRILATGLSTYPDVSVVCGKTLRAADDPIAVTNPILLVEVTSPSTEDYDRGEKLRHYKEIPSVRAVLIVSHRDSLVSVHRREASGWSSADVRRGGFVELESLATPIPVDDLYALDLEDAPGR